MAKATKEAETKPVKKADPKVDSKPEVKEEKKPDTKPKPKEKGSIRDFLDKGKYSQNGEHGILIEAIKRIGLTSGKTAEFGAPSMEYCSNTFELPDTFEKKFYDNQATSPGVKMVTISPDNVNAIIGEVDVLSIDTDGQDFPIWQAYRHTPAIVVIEINSSFPPDIDHVSAEKGASFKSMNELAESKGYFLLIHCGNNIYIRNEYKDLFPDSDDSFMKDWL